MTLQKTDKTNYFHSKKTRRNLSKKQSTIVRKKFKILYKTFISRLYSPNKWTYNRNLPSHQKFWTLQYMSSLIDDTLAIITGTSNLLQEPLEGFLHKNKFTKRSSTVCGHTRFATISPSSVFWTLRFNGWRLGLQYQSLMFSVSTTLFK